MPDRWLQRHDIERLLNEIVAESGPGEPVEITIAGGSALALMGLRDATRDIDSITPIPADIAAHATRIARTQGLDGEVLNSRAAAFRPAGIDVDGDIVIETPRITIRTAAPNALLLMKLHAARPGRDQADMVALWPLSSFKTPERAAEAYATAYPHEQPDPHLANFIRGIQQRAEQRQRSKTRTRRPSPPAGDITVAPHTRNGKPVAGHHRKRG